MEEKQTKWYCLRVVSNKEHKIKERLDFEIDRNGWRNKVPRVVVPTEKVFKIQKGKKKSRERPLTPGYIFVESVVIVRRQKDNNTFIKTTAVEGEIGQLLQGVKDVIHFLGTKSQAKKPIPMRPDEVRRILSKIDESEEAGETLAEPFIIGEEVKVIEGPFNDFIGTIKEVNEEKKKLKLIIKVFGRGTEVELNFMQVEKQS